MILKKIKSFFLTGNLKPIENIKTNFIQIPSEETAIVQELHLIILHELCLFIDTNFEGLSVGDIVNVTIDDSSEYDLWGKLNTH